MNALPTLTQLKHLVALHETLNFTRAAAHCFVTQSTLSASVRELEAVLDAPLVERDKRNVAFTDVGVDVVRRARGLLADAQDLVLACQANVQVFHGKIVLSAIPTIAPFIFPKLLAELRRRYKNAQIYLREEQSDALVQHVRDATADIGILALPFEVPGTLACDVFANDPFLFVAKETSTLRTKTLPLTKLQAEPLLLLEDGHCLRDHAISSCRLDADIQKRLISATSLSTLVQMVESGIGATILPRLAVTGGLLKGHKLTSQLITPTPPARELAVVYRKTSARHREAAIIGKLLQKLVAQ